jgi:plastocyanin
MSMPYTAAREKRTFASLFAAGASVIALLFAALGLFVEKGSSSTVATAAAPVDVSLSEFKITPATINATAGSVTLALTNTGSMAHNLSIERLGKKSAEVAAGGTSTFDIGEVSVGSYEVICFVAGHEASGMKATLVVSAAGSSAKSASTDHSMAGMDMSGADTADWAAMEAQMHKGMEQGLATFVKGGSTTGVGNQKLVPTIEADGTKVFTLESSIIDWHTAPGKTVKAWAYNGMVPGPWIRSEPGDHVKIVLLNHLPVSTDIHFHGITTPFAMDGIAPLTQDYIEPGATFTYEWTNPNHSELGMYHAHDFGSTAVVNGMFAVFQIGDVVLPAGRTIGGQTLPADLKPTQEFPIVVNDAGVIGLSLNGKSYPATAPIAAAPGDVLLVHYYNEGLMTHPMHLHHVPQLVVAKDGFPLDHPYWADTISIAPGERYSVLVMPTNNDIGIWAWHCHILNHAENDQGLFGMVTALVVADPTK